MVPSSSTFRTSPSAPSRKAKGSGLGSPKRLLDLVHESSGGDAFVGLFATAEAQPVYARLGFDGKSSMAGMWQVLRPRP